MNQEKIKIKKKNGLVVSMDMNIKPLFLQKINLDPFFSYQNFKLSKGFLRPASVIIYSPYLSTDNHLMSFRNSSIDCTNFLLLSYCFEPRLISRIRLLVNSLKTYLA